MCDINNNGMKYKIGDKVKIKPLEEFEKCELYVFNMKKYADTIMTIECVDSSDYTYKMKEDGCRLFFSHGMIEGLAETEPFKPSDLQNKDIILHRDGEVGIVVDDIIVYRNGFNWLKGYKESFDVENLSDSDVIAVRRPTVSYGCQFNAFDKKSGELVYDRERDSVVEMTMEEICKALGKNVKIVKEK